MKRSSRPLTRLRQLCLALPEAHEVEAWGEPTFRVRNKIFAMYATANTHHGQGRASVWLKAMPSDQDFLVRAAPNRFFIPPYMGPKGWIGVYLDAALDWAECEALLRRGYGLIAPKRLRARLEESSDPDA